MTDRELAMEIVLSAEQCPHADEKHDPDKHEHSELWLSENCLIERITDALADRYKDGLRRGKEIAEKVELNNMYGQPKGEGSVRFEIALNIEQEIDKP